MSKIVDIIKKWYWRSIQRKSNFFIKYQ